MAEYIEKQKLLNDTIIFKSDDERIKNMKLKFRKYYKSLPTEDVIPLDRVKQTRERINHFVYIEPCVNPYDVIKEVLKVLDKLIAESEGKR